MPKAPILSRECFYQRLRDGSYRDLDWNLVDTTLGAMMEPRNVTGYINGALVQLDVYDSSFTRRTELVEDTMGDLLGTSGLQLPVDFNTQ